MKKQTFQNIDDYISVFPEEISCILNKIRDCIHNAAPKAKESINYNMPAFLQDNRVLVYFAAFQNHIGFYALPSGNAAYQKELSKYKTGKGSIQFPLDEELPFALITEIVKYRIKEIQDRQTKTIYIESTMNTCRNSLKN